MKRFLICFALILGILGQASFVNAQESECDIDLAAVNNLLSEAQSALDNADNLTALELLSEAEQMLSLVVAGCEDWADDLVGSDRAHAVPFGQRQLIDSGRASVEIKDYIPEANDIVMEANRYNDTPMEDQRYIVVEYTYYCDLEPVESCEYNALRVKAVGSRGVVYENFSSGFPLDQEVFGGGSFTVRRGFLVGIDESQFQIFFDYRDDRVFFAVD